MGTVVLGIFRLLRIDRCCYSAVALSVTNGETITAKENLPVSVSGPAATHHPPSSTQPPSLGHDANHPLSRTEPHEIEARRDNYFPVREEKHGDCREMRVQSYPGRRVLSERGEREVKRALSRSIPPARPLSFWKKQQQHLHMFCMIYTYIIWWLHNALSFFWGPWGNRRSEGVAASPARS